MRSTSFVSHCIFDRTAALEGPLGPQVIPAHLINDHMPDRGSRLLLGCMLLVAALRCEAQNLLPNPSFEEADTCAVQMGFFPNGKPLHWEPISDTPDYFRSCVPPGVINGVPVNGFGHQFPHEGDSYAGMAVFLVNDYREMIGAELLEPLTIGQIYYASFWVNAAYGGPQQTGSACNKTGMLMTVNAEPWDQDMPPYPLRDFAQVFSADVISDTAAWILVSGSFVADSAYRFVVIGNHFTNANTVVQVLGPGNANKAYVYVDNVCLSPDPEGCPMWTSILDQNMDRLTLWPNPATDRLRIRLMGNKTHDLLIMDASGRQVFGQHGISEKEVVLGVKEWANGSYIAIVKGNAVQHSKRFVVIH